MTAKPSILTRIRHAIFGAPVSHEEQQAAQYRPTRDPMVDAQHQIRDVRLTGFHGSY